MTLETPWSVAQFNKTNILLCHVVSLDVFNITKDVYEIEKCMVQNYSLIISNTAQLRIGQVLFIFILIH